MSSIEAIPAQEESAAPVPVVHPRWCDRSLCTAPEFRPTEYTHAGYHHRSEDLAVGGDLVPPRNGDQTAEGEVYLSQPVAPWDCSVFLKAGGVSIRLEWNSPLLWAVMDVYAELTERWPVLMEPAHCRAAARKLMQEARRGVSE